MHVLTKIFIVLVSLLTVLLVPLVVVYAYNEDAYKEKFAEAQAQAAAASNAMAAAEAASSAQIQRKDTEIQSLRAERLALQKDLSSLQSESQELRTRLTDAESLNAEIHQRLSTLASAVEAGQDLTSTLIEELSEVRTEALSAQRQKAEIEQEYRDVSAQLEVAIAARRKLQEEVQRLQNNNASLMDQVQVYIGQFGDIDQAMTDRGVPVDKAFDATVLNVRRTNDQSYAEIDAGSRDGVRIGQVLPISSGADFVANLRIVEVDINRSTGVIELESRTPKKVEVGNRVIARPRVR